MHAGFCYGVKRAVDTTKKLKEENPDANVYVLGELIHNSHVINSLNNLGIITLSEIPSCPAQNNDICIIRSHGESIETFEKLKSKGYKIVDLTCLDVKKVQNKAIELSKDNCLVIILGKKEHPEVKAISTDALMFAKNKDNIIIAQNISELKVLKEEIKSAQKVGVVLQTTQTKEYLFEVIDYLTSVCRVLNVQNTICPSTSLRQTEAKKLANKCDLMIVIGSKKSANTTHLANLLSNITQTIHIEDDLELDKYKDLIKSSLEIGITAGASTPDEIINNVIKKIKI